ncbi:MAG: glycosyltransferase [Elusimicrobiaceae bacterium]|nr:glycosyltransferase [Elusimicrobiaceae bacterium]
MTKPRITLFIIAKNEAHRIAACILSARDIVSEVVVVDANSTDKTALVCK